jgi:small GTP-binding protein
MALALMSDELASLWERERDLIDEITGILDGYDLGTSDRRHLQDAVAQANELFLLVIVGEFNSGKSALINALLQGAFLEEGVTPTTDRIHILKYGEAGQQEYAGENVRLLYFPSEILRQIHIVDTPGTNAVLREHEAIAKEFVPRSDLVIFVTSADRPFTESERQFAESIRSWGKKIIVAINKVDILNEQSDVDLVEAFVARQFQEQLSLQPEIFSLSAKRARDGTKDGDQGFERLRKIRLKMLNPLGISLKIGRESELEIRHKLEILSQDKTALERVEKQIILFSEDTGAEFYRHLDRIENELLQLQLRGEVFLDDTMRLLRIRKMLDAKGMRKSFEEQVISNAPDKIEAHIQEIIDWFVEREHRQWRMMTTELEQRRETDALQDAAKEAASGFAYNRRQLLESIGKDAEHVIAGFNRSEESQRLTDTVRDSVALVGLVEVSAISLGLILKAVLTTAAADATGILAASLLGVLGFAIIPFRRGQAKKELRNKVNALKSEMRDVLRASFEQELERACSRLREAIAPYRRFVLTEDHQLQETQTSLRSVLERFEQLKTELGGE